MNIEIPEDTAKLIEGVLASGAVNNAPEYIQALDGHARFLPLTAHRPLCDY